MGSGGVGGYYGSVLFRNGHDVKFIARGEHLEKINSNGLIIKSVTSGNYTVKSDAYDSVPINFSPEIILFTVKAYDNSDAIEIISSAMSKTTSLITLQNGVGSSDLLKNRFPSNNIISGVTYVDSFVTSPGNIVEQGGPCNIIIGNQFQPNLFKGKNIEVDYLNGAVSKFGKKYGVKTPINEYIFRTLSLHNA